jgi:hypothetical protein
MQGKTVPKNVDTGTALVTKPNAGKFRLIADAGVITLLVTRKGSPRAATRGLPSYKRQRR